MTCKITGGRKTRKMRRGGGFFDSFQSGVQNTGSSVGSFGSNMFGSISNFFSSKKEEPPQPTSQPQYQPQQQSQYQPQQQTNYQNGGSSVALNAKNIESEYLKTAGPTYWVNGDGPSTRPSWFSSGGRRKKRKGKRTKSKKTKSKRTKSKRTKSKRTRK